jgi:putative oxidoreductase
MIDVGLLVLRAALGLVVAAHGAQKLFGWWGGGGVAGTQRMFGRSGSGRRDWRRSSAAWRSSAAGSWSSSAC